ncbi:hypothetical protein KUW00_14400 [Halomonas sp. DP5N14-9]|nr:hypothetical protein [Gammaproteobacteria bacterium]MBR9879657.1 hypothetical protein [Gammaproteobacteria bacterium]MBY5942071.1 hypothetical protein [Halomonas sp. DP5N14-9]
MMFWDTLGVTCSPACADARGETATISARPSPSSTSERQGDCASATALLAIG